MCITLRWPLIPSIWSSFIDWQLSLTSSVAGIVWRLVAPFDSQSALLPNVSILSLDHMIAIVLPRQEQWWVFLYEPIHIYPKLSTACSVSLYMLMYFPCICRHVHCQCIIICYDIYVSLKWKVHFCYHLQKQCQKQIQLKLLLSIYC